MSICGSTLGFWGPEVPGTIPISEHHGYDGYEDIQDPIHREKLSCEPVPKYGEQGQKSYKS